MLGNDCTCIDAQRRKDQNQKNAEYNHLLLISREGEHVGVQVTRPSQRIQR